jgi:hypothetical protein
LLRNTDDVAVVSKDETGGRRTGEHCERIGQRGAAAALTFELVRVVLADVTDRDVEAVVGEAERGCARHEDESRQADEQ